MEEVLSEEEPPGGTPFFKADRLGKSLHLNNLFIKFEGANLTGTQKDRISRLHVRNALRKGFDTISVATCGNYGASISYYAGAYGLRSVIGIPETYSDSRLGEISLNGSEIVRIQGKYEEAVDYMSDRARDSSWYDSNPGSYNSGIDTEGYEAIAFEIADQLGHAPEYVAVPVGNGTTLSGIFSGFRKLKQKGLVSELPRMLASSTSNGNPVVDSWIHGARKISELSPELITETAVSEPLVAYRAIDGQKALDAIYESKGAAVYVSDFDMIRLSRVAEELENLSVLPASASALAAAHNLLGGCCSGKEVVAVMTGRNHQWTMR